MDRKQQYDFYSSALSKFILKGGCTIFDVEHMSCSFEFWTRKSRKKNFWPTYGHFLITYFYCHFENVQPNWLDRSSWNFQDRQRSGFEGCSENFVPIWHLWPILQADKGRKWQQKYVIRIFIATLKMYSLTHWTDQAEIFRIVKGVDLRTIQKISSRSDTYGRFYRPIKAENGNKNT